MSRRFIDDLDAVVLDMGNTFMFGCDRFAPGDGIHETYRAVGGRELSRPQVESLIAALLDRMLLDARDPERTESFGSVSHYLSALPAAQDLSAREFDVVRRVFGSHEVGRVSKRHADVLRQLRSTHRLALISNVFADASWFERELARAGVLDAFEVRVWSSSYGCVKPSPRLFQLALSRLGVPAERAVYVGDHPHRDVAGASAVGMKTVWVRNAARPLPQDGPRPDAIVDDISELLQSSPTRAA
jgi:HAD superfamily hydrolase (TIGR01549 family)